MADKSPVKFVRLAIDNYSVWKNMIIVGNLFPDETGTWFLSTKQGQGFSLTLDDMQEITGKLEELNSTVKVA
jgi:hypothetical protein